MTSTDHFIDICDLTTNVMGLRKGSLSYKSREQKFGICRAIASIIGRENGINLTIIANVLKKTRAAIYYYEKNHKDNYSTPTGYDYRDAYNKVSVAYHNLENSKNIFDDPFRMKAYLLRNGVRESKKNQIHILVKSGKVGCTIKTSFLDCSKQTENINLVLMKENYKFEIVDFSSTNSK